MLSLIISCDLESPKPNFDVSLFCFNSDESPLMLFRDEASCERTREWIEH